jgi:hypothetical protein
MKGNEKRPKRKKKQGGICNRAQVLAPTFKAETLRNCER